jgi:cell volume regulation protein A
LEAVLFAGIVLLLSVFLKGITQKHGIPVLLAFIGLGMLFGVDGLVHIDFDDLTLTEEICSLALVFIMFDGGFLTNWKYAKKVAKPAVLLASVGVFLTAALSAVLLHWLLKMTWLESLVTASVLSSTDAASVFSILQAKKLNLKDRTASLLEVESGSNDPAAYLCLMICSAIAAGNLSSIPWLMVKQIGLGLGLGFVFWKICVTALKKFGPGDGFDSVFMIAMCLLAYGLCSWLDGNGYLAVYILGLGVGNADIENKANLAHFFDGLTGLMQVIVFFMLGLLAYPSRLPGVFATSLVVFLVLNVVVRPLVVWMLLKGRSFGQKAVVSWCGLRGASAIVFAVMAMQGKLVQTDIFHITFMVVLLSISIQGSLLPWIAEKLSMMDEKEDVRRTLNEYVQKTPVQYIEMPVTPEHPWRNQYIRDLPLPRGFLIVMVMRDGKQLVPRGDTRIMNGDDLLISTLRPDATDSVMIREYSLEEDDPLIGKALYQFDRDALILMIKRQDEILIPDGSTVLKAGDILVETIPRKTEH